MARGRFSTKQQAMGLRKQVWACLRCPESFDAKHEFCPSCHSPVQYFPSAGELRRYRELQLLQHSGAISDLELQPPFDVVINGEKVFTYRADFKYTRDDQRVIEDVKGTLNEKYLDPVFKLKRKIVEAVFNIQVTIVK